jgi:hypothetical protein
MRSQIQIACCWLAGRLGVIRRCDGPGMEDYCPPPIEHLNLEWFWAPPGTERVSTIQTLFLAGPSTTPLLVPPF